MRAASGPLPAQVSSWGAGIGVGDGEKPAISIPPQQMVSRKGSRRIPRFLLCLQIRSHNVKTEINI